jgi:hypothetical protein
MEGGVKHLVNGKDVEFPVRLGVPYPIVNSHFADGETVIFTEISSSGRVQYMFKGDRFSCMIHESWSLTFLIPVEEEINIKELL